MAKKKYSEMTEKEKQRRKHLIKFYKKNHRKETEEEKKLRADSIQIATIRATSVPFTVIETSIGLIPFLMQVADKGNTNSLSDVGVALLLAKTCANGAYLNVLINLSSLTDEQVRSEVEEKATHALNTINQSVDTFMEMLINRIKG